MTKKLLLSAIVTLLSIVFFSLTASSQTAYLKYTVNGKTYNFTGDDANCFYKKGERGEDDKRDFEETSGYVMILADGNEKISFIIRTQAGTKPTVSKIPYASILSKTTTLPNVYLSLDQEINDEYSFFWSTETTKGTFEVTKSEGDWIEGTFDAILVNAYDTKIVPVKITNGSFRLKREAF